MRVLNPAWGVGGLMASGSVHSTAERAVWIEVLAGDIVLCSWPRHFTLTESFPTRVYQWVPSNLMLGVTLRWTSIPSRGRRSTPSLLILLMSHVARMQSLPSFDRGKIRILRCCFCRGKQTRKTPRKPFKVRWEPTQNSVYLWSTCRNLTRITLVGGQRSHH